MWAFRPLTPPSPDGTGNLTGWTPPKSFMVPPPQEYPKMVPGPNGPQVVQDAVEEFQVLRARLVMLGPTPSLETNDAELPRLAPEIDVNAWLSERKAPQHDWIGALYRPYEPPV